MLGVSFCTSVLSRLFDAIPVYRHSSRLIAVRFRVITVLRVGCLSTFHLPLDAGCFQHIGLEPVDTERPVSSITDVARVPSFLVA